MSNHREAATEVGHTHGVDHANYVDAYGGDLHATPEPPGQFADVPAYYLAGYADGVEDFENRDGA